MGEHELARKVEEKKKRKEKSPHRNANYIRCSFDLYLSFLL